MSLGVVMLVHTAFHRAEQAIRLWSGAGCPMVVHVDAKVPKEEVSAFRKRLGDLTNVRFARRYRCEWGTWGIVRATQDAAEQLLSEFPDVRHVYLASGACLPLRPVPELIRYLDARPQTDFIESATTADVPWTVGGLSEERFTLRFPFSWKTQRRLFDRYVRFQRRIGLKRRLPDGLVPHMGSQWWCLTRRTLSAILEAPDREVYDRYFSRVWIPDESYFQSLARRYAQKIESRSLTLSKFDFQGKPHIFYDDHLELLRRSDCFVARKIWPKANRLYDTFLSGDGALMTAAEPNPGKIDRIFSAAMDQRTRGRRGLYMQSRYPNPDWENGLTAAPYAVFEGFADLFEDFEDWLSRNSDLRVHGHLFGEERAEFEGREDSYAGGLSASAELRDRDPRHFLTSLIWTTRGDHNCFQFGPRDNQAIGWDIAKDANAQINVISGAWAVPLFRANLNFSELRKQAADLQRIESDHLDALRSPYAKAQIRIWTMADFVEAPMAALQGIIDRLNAAGRKRLTEAPRMVDLTGFGQFLQNLKNQGMHPYLMGDFPVEPGEKKPRPRPRRPYVIR